MASFFVGDFDMSIPMRDGLGFPEQDPNDKFNWRRNLCKGRGLVC